MSDYNNTIMSDSHKSTQENSEAHPLNPLRDRTNSVITSQVSATTSDPSQYRQLIEESPTSENNRITQSRRDTQCKSGGFHVSPLYSNTSSQSHGVSQPGLVTETREIFSFDPPSMVHRYSEVDSTPCPNHASQPLPKTQPYQVVKADQVSEHTPVPELLTMSQPDQYSEPDQAIESDQLLNPDELSTHSPASELDSFSQYHQHSVPEEVPKKTHVSILTGSLPDTSGRRRRYKHSETDDEITEYGKQDEYILLEGTTRELVYFLNTGNFRAWTREKITKNEASFVALQKPKMMYRVEATRTFNPLWLLPFRYEIEVTYEELEEGGTAETWISRNRERVNVPLIHWIRIPSFGRYTRVFIHV